MQKQLYSLKIENVAIRVDIKADSASDAVAAAHTVFPYGGEEPVTLEEVLQRNTIAGTHVEFYVPDETQPTVLGARIAGDSRIDFWHPHTREIPIDRRELDICLIRRGNQMQAKRLAGEMAATTDVGVQLQAAKQLARAHLVCAKHGDICALENGSNHDDQWFGPCGYTHRFVPENTIVLRALNLLESTLTESEL